jgi:hypothetical protein
MQLLKEKRLCMKKKLNKKFVTYIKPIVSLLYFMSYWCLGTWLATSFINIAFKSDLFIKSNIIYLILGLMGIPLHYLNKYLQKQ